MNKPEAKISNPRGRTGPVASAAESSVSETEEQALWTITGYQQFSELSGQYAFNEVRSLLIYAQEQSPDQFSFDHLISGSGPGTALLSGSQLLAAVHSVEH